MEVGGFWLSRRVTTVALKPVAVKSAATNSRTATSIVPVKSSDGTPPRWRNPSNSSSEEANHGPIQSAPARTSRKVRELLS